MSSSAVSDESSVAVALRVRPLLPKEKLESCNICLTTIPQSNQVILGNDKQFTFDHVFDPVSKQGDIYATTVVPLLDAVFQGYNATAFAYGQTGSGKSYTMGTATCADDADQGIIPRVIHDLFARIERAQHNCQFEVFVSYIEIYNETLKDLLHPATSPKQISIREDDSGGIVVCGAQTQRAHTIAELWSLVQHGTTYRATAATMMNTASSRSHSILTLHLQQQEGDPYNGEYRRYCHSLSSRATSSGPCPYCPLRLLSSGCKALFVKAHLEKDNECGGCKQWGRERQC